MDQKCENHRKINISMLYILVKIIPEMRETRKKELAFPWKMMYSIKAKTIKAVLRRMKEQTPAPAARVLVACFAPKFVFIPVFGIEK